jgi:prepilin-type N-terminal cleavage/methylation domain-containing protein
MASNSQHNKHGLTALRYANRKNMLMRGWRRNRRGFSMLEVIALVAIMAILAAAVIPVTIGGVDSRAVTAASVTLDSLRVGINRYQVEITEYPSRLSQLSDSVPVTPYDFDSCNLALAGDAARYQSRPQGAPFFQRTISTTGGLPLGIGNIDDAIPTRTAATDMFLNIRNVRVIDGQALNDIIDGTAEVDIADGSNTAGNIRYPVPSANGTYTVVQYRVTRNTANQC